MKFKDKFKDAWTNSGGFVTQAIAAKILGISPGSVAGLIKKNTLRSFKPDDKTGHLPYYIDVIQYQPHENKKRFKKESPNGKK